VASDELPHAGELEATEPATQSLVLVDVGHVVLVDRWLVHRDNL
jgi:hypothetical protein